LERQREGIQIAKAAGKYKGRKAVNIDPGLFNTLFDEYSIRKINKSQFAYKYNYFQRNFY
jgi:DNA invertase Pin-like site-specific DNA recombinase